MPSQLNKAMYCSYLLQNARNGGWYAGGWRAVVGASLVAGSAYAAALYVSGGREEERAIIRRPAVLAVSLVRSFYRGVWGTSRRAP